VILNRPGERAHLRSWEGWHDMAKTQNYSKETRQKAIRLVREHAGDYPSEYAAITAVAGRLGMTAETLRKWIRQAEVDGGSAPGVTTEEAAQVRQLRRKVAELERTIEILSAATGFFARAHDPRQG
jgi:transposase